MELKNFKGVALRLANNWLSEIKPGDAPIKYLEVGTYYGANLISVEKIYATHPDSELHCIDPWEDYSDYDEYKGEMPSIYSTFGENIKAAGIEKKVSVHRGYSHKELVKFSDEYFDMIYIDGNHKPEYVLEDCVLAFRKLKPNGYMVIDDFGWGGDDYTQRGIIAFFQGFRDRIHIHPAIKDTQVFVQKKN